jgi:RND superfamily putative drug exporter
LLLAAPAIGLTTAAPGIDELPSSNEARQSSEAIEDAVGPGWEAPFVLVAATQEGPITTPERLALLSRAQKRIVREPGIRAVIGPGAVAQGTAPLRQVGETLASPERTEQLERLGPGLRRAAGAVAQLRGGLREGAAGSALLGEGAERARQGAGLLADGLERAAEGGEAATGAIGRLADGSERLADAQRKAAVGSLSLQLGLRTLVPQLRGNSLRRARELASSLAREAEENPALLEQSRQARTLARAIAAARDEARRLRGIAEAVNGGLNRVAGGGERLEEGVRRLEDASADLGSGLGRLGSGARRLAGGLGELRGGVGALEQGLADGFHRSQPLEAGLRRSSVRVAAVAAPLAEGTERLRRSSPKLFDSGYFVLSALEGASPRRRALAGEAVSIDRGGQAARMLIISDYGLNTDESREIGDSLVADADRIARDGDLETGLTGGAAILNDYGEVTRARIPLVVAAVVIACFLMLVLILRAPLLAAIGVVLNLGTVAAAIGVMTLVCQIPDGYPLGGHPYVDTVGAAAIFGVTFGLSIDYAVFLLARMRERYVVDRDNAAAIEFGIGKTASVITGAAAIMVAVFISFAGAPVATVSQMGVGLTVAILLDATVVRIVLLPALMLVLGDRVWHTPAWLDRLLPNVDPHGVSPRTATSPSSRG